MTLQISDDLRAETDELYAFLETLDAKDWETPTLFMGWTPWDIVAHLHFFDEVSLASLAGREEFAARQKVLVEGMTSGLSGREQTQAALKGYDAKALLERWKSFGDDMASQLGESDPKRRLPWFGPDMGVQMFTTARYMETWSHSQAIYDLKDVSREHSDRIKNIVAIGVKTFGWTFVNRKLEVPGPAPFVRLTAPSGEIWEYNVLEDSAPSGEDSEVGEERIEGSAVDFCLTVTQVRNVKDTKLEVVGRVANAWMEIAQCFAGGPVDPPKPGFRLGH
jgi:uncharacterized protein (TIGR03084 family)